MTSRQTPDPAVAVITIASGRHEHLRRQLAGLEAGNILPGQHVVVAMNDPDIRAITTDQASTTLLEVSSDSDGLELSAARNVGAQAAIDRGAKLLVFLDVDCIPGPELIGRYRQAAQSRCGDQLLLCGPVTYLRPDEPIGNLERRTRPHPARPNPPAGDVTVDDRWALFWSLSFAITATGWEAVGGFHPGYRGYGGEDTDFAMSALDKGFRIAWVGGAHAYHQWHPVSDPPVEHLDDILRNALIFHRRWHRWPMEGWLNAFVGAGLITYDPATESWRRAT